MDNAVPESRHFPALFLLSIVLGITPANAAPGQLPLLHSLFDPSTNAQHGAGQGSSVAVDGNIVVVGVPDNDVGGDEGSGVVNVYDATDGTRLHTLTNPMPAELGLFGRTIAISGTRVVVGAPGDATGANDAGIAYVYDLASASPEEPVAVLPNPSPADGDLFGRAASISGTRVVIGAIYDDTGAIDAGIAYVFDLSGASPEKPVVTLNNPSPADYDNFGYAVAISGNRVVIGVNKDDTGAEDAGRTYVYDLAGNSPTLPAITLNNPNPTTRDNFGEAVAISGHHLIVGAYQDDAGAPNAGIAYVYDLTSATPAMPRVVLHNPNPDIGDFFGYSLAVSGTRVVVGAYDDDLGATNAGIAYLFELSSTSPSVPILTLTNPSPTANAVFAHAIAISGPRLVVGEPGNDTRADNAGCAHVYDLAGPTPALPMATLGETSPASHNNFGVAVAVSGNRVVVGATYDDTGATDAGRAYVYDLATITPTVPVVALNNPNPEAGDWFGWAVAISGTRVVVGAMRDDAGAINAGSAYVYDLAGGSPAVPVVSLTNPAPALSDSFGYSVAISGTRIVIGAFEDDAGATDSGSAYLYDLASASPMLPVARLSDPAPARTGHFGASVALSGPRVIVGGAQNRVHLYDLLSETPAVPTATLTNPSSPAAVGSFGHAVAIDGTRVLVGAPFERTDGIFAGTAYAYDLAGANPAVPVLTLNNPEPAPSDMFGGSVSIAGTRIVIGADNDVTEATKAGSAWVYESTSATPTVPVARLAKPRPKLRDMFGCHVAADGTTVVVGAMWEDTVAADRGAAYVYGAWPTLSIAPAAQGLATVSWTPATSSGFTLQYADDFTSANWTNALGGEANPVTISLTNAARYYRLFQP